MDPSVIDGARQLQGRLLLGIPPKRGPLLKMGGTSFGFARLKDWKDRWVVLDGAATHAPPPSPRHSSPFVYPTMPAFAPS